MVDKLSDPDEGATADGAFRELVKGGRWVELLALLNQRIEKDPNDNRQWYCRGLVLLQMCDGEAALRDFAEAIRLDPHYVRAYLGRGDACLKLRQVEAAFDAYNQAIAIAPTYGASYWSRGVAYCEQNRFAEAIDDFTQAVHMSPGWALPYLWRAGARQDAGDLDGALADYGVFLQLEGKHAGLRAEAFGARAFLFKKLGLLQQSIEEYGKELQINPQSAMAYLGRSGAYKLLGDQTQAETDYSRAIEIDPNIEDEE